MRNVQMSLSQIVLHTQKSRCLQQEKAIRRGPGKGQGCGGSESQAEQRKLLFLSQSQGTGPGPSERQWHVLLPFPSSSIHHPFLPAPGLLPSSQPLSCPKLSCPPWFQRSHCVLCFWDTAEMLEERSSGCGCVGSRLFSLILSLTWIRAWAFS